MLVDVIKHAFFVAHGVEYFFRKGIDHLYEQFGIYDGKQEYPTFRLCIVTLFLSADGYLLVFCGFFPSPERTSPSTVFGLDVALLPYH